MAHECVVLADCPGALVELCGISTLERLLRTLQRCGIERATILSSASERIAEELARPSWPRAQLALALRTRPNGAVRIEQILDIWPAAAQLLLVIRGDAVFDSRLLQLLATQRSAAVLVDSAVPSKLQPLVAQAPDALHAKVCGAALLQRDWVSAQRGPIENAINNGLEQKTIAAVDVTNQPSYSPALRRKLKPFWFPAPPPEHVNLAERIFSTQCKKEHRIFPHVFMPPSKPFSFQNFAKPPSRPVSSPCHG